MDKYKKSGNKYNNQIMNKIRSYKEARDYVTFKLYK